MLRALDSRIACRALASEMQQRHEPEDESGQHGTPSVNAEHAQSSAISAVRGIASGLTDDQRLKSGVREADADGRAPRS